MMPFPHKRIAKELSKITTSGPPPGITMVSTDNLEEWLVDIEVIGEHPIYEGQKFRLKIVFGDQYPIEPPEVTFVRAPDRNIPIHPHIYSNGIICLDLLYTTGWSPVQNVESVCMSLQSMLTGNTINEKPEGDERFSQMAANYKIRDIEFLFHDDTV